MHDNTCSTTGRLKRGLCSAHYQRWSYNPSRDYQPLPAKRQRGWSQPAPLRFWKKVIQGSSCWSWAGGTTRAGYGRLFIDGHHVLAHRFSYELHRGPIPEGKYVLHTCDNRICTNPDHLFIGTQRDNMRDAANKDRLKSKTLDGRTKLTTQQVSEIRAGSLSCRKTAALYGVSYALVSAIRRGTRR